MLLSSSKDRRMPRQLFRRLMARCSMAISWKFNNQGQETRDARDPTTVASNVVSLVIGRLSVVSEAEIIAGEVTLAAFLHEEAAMTAVIVAAETMAEKMVVQKN